METLRMLKGITDTVIIATHDMQLVCDWAERIIVLSGGRVIADGTKEQILQICTSGTRLGSVRPRSMIWGG